jgi:type II secretory pathway component GspD/PulD (secretin)
MESGGSRWDEGKYQSNKRKTEAEVADLIKQYRVLHKEGKYKEALAAARKAKELDPDNLAADAAIQITTIAINQQNYSKGVKDNEDLFVNALNPGPGPYVDMSNPLKLDAEAQKRSQARDSGKNGFWTPTRDPVERAIERRLEEPITLTFKDTPLHQVISDLQMLSGVNIIPDRDALAQANVSLDQELTLPVEKIKLKSALNILLDQLRLTYVIKDQVLQITTKEKAQGRMRMVTYSVADLVVPVDNHPTPGINDMNTALARHLASNSGLMSNSSSPYTTPMTLPGGAAVSSQSSGVGSTFALNGSGVSPPSVVQTRAPGQTLEDLLINLIQNTVAQNTWKDVGGQGSIQYYPLGMALVVNQTQEVQEDVAALLASLRRLQDLEVAIEMRLVSVSESFFERMGVDFNVNFNGRVPQADQNALLNGQFTPFGQVNSQFKGLNAVTGLTPAGTLTPDLGIPIKTGSFGFSVPPFGGYPGTFPDGGLSLGLAFLSEIQVFMFLEAAQGDRRLNVMQAPKITVFNGQTANIDVQDQQFFLTGVNIFQANGQTFFNPNNQPFPLGVSMQVTPVVSADRRFVRLNLTPNLTNLASTTVPLIPVQIPVPQLFEGPGNGSTQSGQPVIFQMFFQQPTMTTISVNTTVNVPDGGTVLLGGLKTMSEGRNEFGPPILSKIPYLSRLFKNVAYGRDGQSLMIMVTPRIIINEEEEQIYLGNLAPIPRP